MEDVNDFNIKIDKKYHITADKRQYILHEKIKNSEELSYYTNFSDLIKSYIRRKINVNKNIKTLKQLDNNIEKYGKRCEEILKKCLTSSK